MRLIFTQPLFTDANVVIAGGPPYVADLSALENATVALPSGTFIEESVRRDFPGCTSSAPRRMPRHWRW